MLKHIERIRGADIGKEVSALLKELTGQDTMFAIIICADPSESAPGEASEIALISNMPDQSMAFDLMEELAVSGRKKTGH